MTAPETVTNTRQTTVVKPVVINLKKNKRRRYSRGLRDIQIIERRLSKASHRMTQAMEKGVAEYRKSRNKSARRRRDGAIIDFWPNIARGLGESLREASAIPYDVTQAFYTKRNRRRIRRRLRRTSRFIEVFID